MDAQILTENEENFMNKWGDLSLGDYWNSDPGCIFWARSFNLEDDHVLEMAYDFLSIGYPRERVGMCHDRALSALEIHGRKNS